MAGLPAGTFGKSRFRSGGHCAAEKNAVQRQQIGGHRDRGEVLTVYRVRVDQLQFEWIKGRRSSEIFAFIDRHRRRRMDPLRSHVLDEVCKFDRSDRKVSPEGNVLMGIGRVVLDRSGGRFLHS